MPARGEHRSAASNRRLRMNPPTAWQVHGSSCFDVMLHANGSHRCLNTSNCPHHNEVCESYSGGPAHRAGLTRSGLHTILDAVAPKL